QAAHGNAKTGGRRTRRPSRGRRAGTAGGRSRGSPPPPRRHRSRARCRSIDASAEAPAQPARLTGSRGRRGAGAREQESEGLLLTRGAGRVVAPAFHKPPPASGTEMHLSTINHNLVHRVAKKNLLAATRTPSLYVGVHRHPDVLAWSQRPIPVQVTRSRDRAEAMRQERQDELTRRVSYVPHRRTCP